jgi:hypothetical protein
MKDIPERFFGKEKAQAKAADILSALVDLIGQQVSHFAILQNRTRIEQGLGYFLQAPPTNLDSTSADHLGVSKRRSLRKCAEEAGNGDLRIQPVSSRCGSENIDRLDPFRC